MSKKMMMGMATIVGISTMMYYYFKKNPEKLDGLRYKMMATACDMKK